MKKTSRPDKPLALNRRSLRVLTDERLQGVAAGTSCNCTRSQQGPCVNDAPGPDQQAE